MATTSAHNIPPAEALPVVLWPPGEGFFFFFFLPLTPAGLLNRPN